MATNAIHLNNDLLVATYIATTGPNPQEHDIVEIVMLPLDSEYNPWGLPFQQTIKPRFPENVKPRTKLPKPLDWYSVHGIEFFEVGRLFDVWFERTKRRENKQLQLLVESAIEVMPFLWELIGPINCASAFSEKIRDLRSTALFMNDWHYKRAEGVPFQKLDFAYLRSSCGIIAEEYTEKDPMQQCLRIVEIYEWMLKYQR